MLAKHFVRNRSVFRIIFFQFKEYKEYITILYIPKILIAIIDINVSVKLNIMRNGIHRAYDLIATFFI